jgi:hypothetical protein
MPCKRASLSIVALLGNLEGVCLLGLLREKKTISGFLPLDPEDISIGTTWNFGRNRAPLI